MTDAISDPFSGYRPDPWPLPTPTPAPELRDAPQFDEPDFAAFDTAPDYEPLWPTATPGPELEVFDDFVSTAPQPMPLPTPTPLGLGDARDTMMPAFDPAGALPAAYLSRAVYGDDVPAGFDIDPEFSVDDPSTGFKAALYLPTDGGAPVLAYAGTEMKNWRDWVTNLQQGAGFVPRQYDNALELAQRARERYGNDVVLTGHSLGGGLATYAGMHTGSEVIAFNAAGLSWRARAELWWDDKLANAERITQVRVANEILSSAPLLPLLGDPEQVGNQVELPAARPEPRFGWNPLLWPFEALGPRLSQRGANHGMDQVIASLEQARAAQVGDQ